MYLPNSFNYMYIFCYIIDRTGGSGVFNRAMLINVKTGA
jgi:hypothetical protein